MADMRHAARSDANQTQIVDAFRSAGASVYVIKLPVDIIVGYAGKTALVEIKTSAGKYTELQRNFMAGWKGGTVATIRDVGGALTLLGAMNRGK